MASLTRGVLDTSAVTFHLLRHWWVEKKCDPPYDLFGGEVLFWDFSATAGLILERYERVGRCWPKLIAEYSDQLIAIIEGESRRPKGQEIHDLAKSVAEKFKDVE